ncbi:hypothetical protein NC651_026206 [Populus alba x Populus x berolinensis]|nr:hypothetical protein NC651_026206 [Populus alba x Populus x berolinensis]
MGSLTISETPYIAAMNGDWQGMIDYYQEHGEFLYSPVTLSLDTGFHLAVHSNAERPLKDLLEIMGRSKDGESILHQRSKDGQSILGAAIIGQHFETALLLLELDESLHDLEDKMGRTALQLLAEMPTGFESGYPMSIFERLIYSCLPVIRHHEVKSQVQTWCRAMKDLESGTPGSSLEKNRRGSLLNYLKVPKGIGHN